MEGVQSQTQANEAAGVEFAWVPGKGRGRQDTGAVVSPKEARDETLDVGDWGTDLKEWAHESRVLPAKPRRKHQRSQALTD